LDILTEPIDPVSGEGSASLPRGLTPLAQLYSEIFHRGSSMRSPAAMLAGSSAKSITRSI